MFARSANSRASARAVHCSALVNSRALFLTATWLTLACSSTTTDNPDSSAFGSMNEAGGTTVAGGDANGGRAGGVAGGAASSNATGGAGGVAGGAGSSSTTGGAHDSGGAAAGQSESGGGAQAGTVGAGGASGGSAGSAGAGGASGVVLDYSLWQLQLPSGTTQGNPDTIQPNQLKSYSDLYFYRASDGGQIFMDPPFGIATSGSNHPRTELREMKPSGGGASWSATATNRMTVRGKAIKCSSCTIGQIFREGEGTLIELQYTSGGSMKLLYEEQKGSPEPLKDLGVSVPLGQMYTYEFSLSKGTLEVSVNGQVRYMRTPTASAVTNCYFKVGNYDQGSTKNGNQVSTDVRSQIENYSIVVQHE